MKILLTILSLSASVSAQPYLQLIQRVPPGKTQKIDVSTRLFVPHITKKLADAVLQARFPDPFEEWLFGPHVEERDVVVHALWEQGLAFPLMKIYGAGYEFNGIKLQADLLKVFKSNKSLWNRHQNKNKLSIFIARLAKIVLENRLNATAPASHPPTRPISIKATPYIQKDLMVDGMRLRYIDVHPRKAKGTILLIHGHQSSIEEFNRLIPFLKDEYRIVAADLPGSGYSDQPNRDYSLAFYEKTLVHFIDQLGIRNVIVAGGSLGGNLALRLGRRDPSRFLIVISWSPAGVWCPKKILSDLARMSLMQASFYWLTIKVQSDACYRKDFSQREEFIREGMLYRREVDSTVFRRATVQIASEQLRKTNRGLGYLNRQPTLLIVGREDKALNLAENAIEFSKELPDVKLVIFEKTGHSIHIERPKELADEIKKFLLKMSNIKTGELFR